ncbi:hypothetical protein [Nonomuraea sp. NPDC049504]|uniref:hypothetical protein n=1 Tax=Nonomuraea sp. NPDC049504 TaxID=3154729 RepID=UPI00341F74C9
MSDFPGPIGDSWIKGVAAGEVLRGIGPLRGNRAADRSKVQATLWDDDEETVENVIRGPEDSEDSEDSEGGFGRAALLAVNGDRSVLSRPMCCASSDTALLLRPTASGGERWA